MKKNILIVTNKKNIYVKNVPIAVRKEALIKYLAVGKKIESVEIKYYKNKEIYQYLVKELGEELENINIEELFDYVIEWKDLN
ncbi:hypothetical protein [Clostridium faecium]|uniref:Uncharacterized protein n=1 Tax=Clostridium faecium TaxID=2762223 RepID=A0ABR8YNN5_9CLOT|nr:hypothetical protein [Clostridium faecium]MBD8045830.1 hypothetical protein [Clostridium faecium]